MRANSKVRRPLLCHSILLYPRIEDVDTFTCASNEKVASIVWRSFLPEHSQPNPLLSLLYRTVVQPALPLLVPLCWERMLANSSSSSQQGTSLGAWTGREGCMLLVRFQGVILTV